MLENKLTPYQFYFFFFILYFIIFLTNNHFSFQESLLFGGADGMSYFNISKEAPFISDAKITPIHSERFLFPYLIGLLSKILKIEIFITYKILVLVVLFLINLYLFKIFNIFKLDRDNIIIYLTFINLNPYISRFYIAIPTIITDLILTLGFIMIIKNILSLKVKYPSTLIGFAISFASRQTSIALILSYLTSVFISKNRFFNKKLEISILILFVIFSLLSIYYSNHTFDDPSARAKLYSVNMRIFGIFFQDISINQKVIFLILPALSFGPILLYFILFRSLKLKIKEIYKSNILIFIISLILIVILQPILSGPEISSRNIIRLTTLAYIPLVIFLVLITKNRVSFKAWYSISLVLIFCFLHSLHPTFSKFKFFEFLKF